MATRTATYPPAYSHHSSAAAHVVQRAAAPHVPNWPQPPYQGAPPIPAGVSVNPQHWNAGVWQYNPAYNHSRAATQAFVPWIPSHQWMPQGPQPGTSQASQQAAQQQQQNYNPYKRQVRPPSAEYLATKLSDNPLGLTNMIPAEEYYKQTPEEEVHTPWIWKPRELVDGDSQSRPSGNSLRRHATEPVISSGKPKSSSPDPFTSKIELQTTFSPKIVRTPDHYRHERSDPSSPPTPSRSSRSSTTDSLSSRMSSLSLNSMSTSSSISRHSSMPPSLLGSTADMTAPMLTEQISAEPDSMLSPLILSSTPVVPSSNLRSVRNHHTHPIIGPVLDPIPEAPQYHQDRNGSTKEQRKEDKRHRPQQSASLGSIPASSRPKIHQTSSYPQISSQTSRIGSRHTTTTFIESSTTTAPNVYPTSSHIAQPNPNALVSVSSLTQSSPTTPSPRSIAPSRSSSPRSRKSSQPSPEDLMSGKPLHHPSPDQPQTTSLAPPASTTRLHSPSPNPNPRQPAARKKIEIPRQMSPPPSYSVVVRHGYWNRRGDHLLPDGHIVLAPEDKAYPRDLHTYPAEKEGYMDHNGQWVRWVNRRVLPESVPRQGKEPEYPWEKFVVWVYK